MGKVYFDGPTTLIGSEQEQLRQIYSYLYAMSEKLNEAMNSITEENMDQEIQVKINQIPSKEDRTQEANALKSLIIKTAQIVRSEMDEIRTTLESNYQAISEEFGEYNRNLTSNITATAEGILQDYRFEERIQSNTDTMEGFIHKTNQYIYSGLIDTVTEGGVTRERYGIAIGNNVTDTDQEGNESLNRDNMMSTFTMDELAFYVNAVKVAWFSNSVFNISDGRITNTLRIGNHVWRTLANGALVLNVVQEE